jgi:hypothetical protein
LAKGHETQMDRSKVRNGKAGSECALVPSSSGPGLTGQEMAIQINALPLCSGRKEVHPGPVQEKQAN